MLTKKAAKHTAHECLVSRIAGEASNAGVVVVVDDEAACDDGPTITLARADLGFTDVDMATSSKASETTIDIFWMSGH